MEKFKTFVKEDRAAKRAAQKKTRETEHILKLMHKMYEPENDGKDSIEGIAYEIDSQYRLEDLDLTIRSLAKLFRERYNIKEDVDTRSMIISGKK